MSANNEKMSATNEITAIDSVREWVVDHKLRTVGCLWLSGLAGSIAYNWSQPGMKNSVRIIHARLHAQAHIGSISRSSSCRILRPQVRSQSSTLCKVPPSNGTLTYA